MAERIVVMKETKGSLLAIECRKVLRRAADCWYKYSNPFVSA